MKRYPSQSNPSSAAPSSEHINPEQTPPIADGGSPDSRRRNRQNKPKVAARTSSLSSIPPQQLSSLMSASVSSPYHATTPSAIGSKYEPLSKTDGIPTTTDPSHVSPNFATMDDSAIPDDKEVEELQRTGLPNQKEHISRVLSKPRPSPTMDDLNRRTKDELVKMGAKMSSELAIKNKIIQELKGKEGWLVAEVATYKSQVSGVIATDKADVIADALVRNESSQMDPAKLNILKTLLSFKEQLQDAKDKVEQQELKLIDLYQKKSIAEEEASYYKAQLTAQLPNSSFSSDQVLNTRIQTLEARLKDTLADLSSLQGKVSQWARASKRNQEGRILAEACQKALEEELVKARLSVKQGQETETRLRRRLERFAATHANQSNSGSSEKQDESLIQKQKDLQQSLEEKTAQFQTLQRDYEASQARIFECEKTMEEAYTTVESLQTENTSLQSRISALEQMESQNLELQSRMESISSLEKVNDELRSQISAMAPLENELENLKAQLTQVTYLQNENAKLRSQVQSLGSLTSENDKLRAAVDSLELLKQEHTELKSREQSMSHLEKENESLRNKLQTMSVTSMGNMTSTNSKEVSSDSTGDNGNGDSHLQQQLSQTQQQFNELSKSYHALLDEKNRLHRTCESLELKTQETERKYHALKASFKSSDSEVQWELDNLRDREQDYQMRLQRNQEEINRLQEIMATLLSTSPSVRSPNDPEEITTMIFGDVKGKINQYQERIDTLEKKLAEEHSNSSQLQQKLDTVESQLLEKESTLSRFQEEVSSLQQDSSRQQADDTHIQNLENNLEATRKEVDMLQRELSERKSDDENRVKELQELLCQLETAQEQLSELKNSLEDRVKEGLVVMDAEVKILQQTLVAKEEALTALNRELGQLRNSNEELQKSLEADNTTENNTSQLETQLVQEKEKAEMALAQTMDLIEELDGMRKKVQALEKEGAENSHIFKSHSQRIAELESDLLTKENYIDGLNKEIIRLSTVSAPGQDPESALPLDDLIETTLHPSPPSATNDLQLRAMPPLGDSFFTATGGNNTDILELQKKIKSAQKSIDILSNELRDRDEYITQLEDDSEKLEARVEVLQNECQDLREAALKQRPVSISLDPRVDDMQKQIEQLQKDLLMTKEAQERTPSSSPNPDAAEKIKELESIIQNQKRKIDQLREEMKTQIAERDSYIAQLEEDSEGLEARLDAVIDERDKLEEQIKARGITQESSKVTDGDVEPNSPGTTEKYNELKQWSENLLNEIEVSRKEYDELKSESDMQAQSIQSLQNDLEKAEATIKQLEADLKKSLEFETDLLQTQINVQHIETELNTTRETLEKATADLEKAKSQKAELQEELIQTRQKLQETTALDELKDVHEHSLSEKQLEIDRLNTDLVACHAEVDSLQDQLQSANTRLKETSDLTQSHVDTIQKLQEEIQQLETELAHTKHTNDSVEMLALQDKIKHQSQQLETLHQELGAKSSLIEKFHSDTLEKEQRVVELEAELEALMLSKADVEGRVSKLQNALQSKEEELAELKTTLEKTLAKDELDAYITESEKKLAIAQKQRSDLEADFAELKEDLVLKEKSMAVLQAQISEMNVQHDEEHDLLQSKLERQSAELKSRLAEIEELRVKVEVYNNLNASLDQLKISIEEKDAEVQQLQRELETNVKTTEELLAQVDNYEEEILSLRERLEQQAKSSTDSLSTAESQRIQNDLQVMASKLAAKSSELDAAQAALASFKEDQKRTSPQDSKRIKDLEAVNKQLLSQLEKMGQQLAQSDANRRVTMESGYEKQVRDMLQAATEKSDNDSKTIAALRDEISSAYDKISALMTEKSQLMDRIQDMEEEQKQLHSRIKQLTDIVHA